MIQVYREGEWKEEQPEHGEKFREVIEGHVIRVSYYCEPQSEE